MNILSIDTATEVLGVGIRAEDGGYVSVVKRMGLHHAEMIMPAVEYVLAQAGIQASDLHLLVCAKGPGSFTGLRIGISTVKGLAFGLGIPFISVPTLDAMAYGNSYCRSAVMPVIDGRKKRVYTALYKEGNRISDYLDAEIKSLASFDALHDGILLTGPGAEIARAGLPPSAKIRLDTLGGWGWNMAYLELGEKIFREHGGEKADAGPFYIRKSDAEMKLQEKTIDATR